MVSLCKDKSKKLSLGCTIELFKTNSMIQNIITFIRDLHFGQIMFEN